MLFMLTYNFIGDLAIIILSTNTKMKKNCQEGKSTPVPVERSDFKPRVDKKACQYCEYKGSSRNVDVHVNSQHEMQEWFKCMICNLVTLYNDHMILHLRCYHKLKVDREEINKLIVKDPNEILKHKKAMIKKEPQDDW